MSRRGPPGRDLRCSLLVRNLSRSVRPDDLRHAGEKYGHLRDVYLPRDFYTGEPRGIGFLEYLDPRDAEDARDGLDRAIINGREVAVVFAQQGRKAPEEYRARRGHGFGETVVHVGRRRSYSPRRRSYSPRSRRRSPSRSPSRGRSRTPRRSRQSRSPSASRSPKKRYSQESDRAKSASRSRSPARADDRSVSRD